MRVAIIKSHDLADVIKRAVTIAASLKENDLHFFSTSEIQEKLRDILNKSKVVSEIQVSNKTVYIAKGIMIQLEDIDYYE